LLNFSLLYAYLGNGSYVRTHIVTVGQ